MATAITQDCLGHHYVLIFTPEDPNCAALLCAFYKSIVTNKIPQIHFSMGITYEVFAPEKDYYSKS